MTVVVPVRNETQFIETCVHALLTQDSLPANYEVLVIDGASDDGTREKLDAIAATDSRLRVLENRARIVPTALNRGISEARGDVIIRVDGHTKVAPDFVRANLKLLEAHPEAWSVGGPIAHRGHTTVGRAIAAAMSSPVGVGGARHRFKNYEGYAEGTAFPAFRKWVFERIGMFDERLVRNQDDELNFRITQAGGQIFISPMVKHDYFVRASYRALFNQYMQYAYWKVEVMRKHRRVISARHLVPGAFIVGVPVCLSGAVLMPFPMSLVFATPIVAYGVLLAGLATSTSMRERSIGVGLGAALAAAVMHAGYGLGTLAGIGSRPGSGGPIERLMSKLTR